ncbi:MAG: NF038143 family protein [Desulfosalsimonadaceae bacterium]
MGKTIDKNYVLLAEQEQLFVKRVVYLMRAHSPRPWWRMFIPFAFLLEYFARKKDVRTFAKAHLHLKEAALEAAYQEAASGRPEKNDSTLQARISDYLTHMQDIQSPELYDRLYAWAALLKDHYARMLPVQEKFYNLVLQNAYPSGGEYKRFLQELADAENGIDQLVLAARKDKEQAGIIIANKQKAFQQVREREIREAFGSEWV